MEFLERFGLTSLDQLPVVDAAVAQRLTIPEADAADAADAAAQVPVVADDPGGVAPALDAGLPAGWPR